MFQVQLKVVGGKYDGRLIPMVSSKFLIGREQDCHLRPNSELVSRHHCVISIDDFAVRVRDLGSTNGTFVNGQRIRGQVTVESGHSVQVGKLKFEVLIEESKLSAPDPGESVPPKPHLPVNTSEAGPEALPEALSDSQVNSSDTTILNAPILPLAAQPQPGEVPPGFVPMQQMPQFPQYPAVPTGYPQAYPPGYPAPGMMYPPQAMPYPGQPMQSPMANPAAGAPPAPTEEAVADTPAVRLPDPNETGAVDEEPSPPPAEAEAAGETVEKPSNSAADIIQRYMKRPRS